MPSFRFLIKYIEIGVVFFLCFFAVTFEYPGFSFSKIFVLFGIALYLQFPSYQRRVNQLIADSTITNLFFYLFSLLLVSIALPVIKGTFDFSFVTIYLSFILDAVPFSIFFCAYYQKYLSVEGLVKLIINVSFAQSIIIFLMLSSDIFREFIFGIQTGNSEFLFASSGFRGMGLSSILAYGFSVQLSIALILIVYRWFEYEDKRLFALLSIFGSIFFVGRTGYLGLVFACFWVLGNIMYFRHFKVRFNNLPRVAGFVISVLISVLLIFNFIVPLVSPEVLKILIHYSFEMFSNEDGLSTTSSDRLFEMLADFRMPQSFLGDAIYSIGGDYYMDTDVGYFRYIYFFGLPLACFVLGFYLFLTKGAYDSVSNLRLKGVVMFIGIYLFSVQVKGSIFDSAFIVKFFVLLTVVGMIEKRRDVNVI